MRRKFLFTVMAFLLSAVGAMAHLASGRYVIESAVNRNYCIDLDNGNVCENGRIWCYSWNGGDAQIWDVISNSDGTYSIYNCRSDRYCISHDHGFSDGKRIKLSYDRGSREQRWYMESHGDYYVIRSADNDNYVIDLYMGRAADMQQISLWSDNGTNSQRWHFRMIKNYENGYGPGGHHSYDDGGRAPHHDSNPRPQVIDAGGEVAFKIPGDIDERDITYYYWDVNESSKLERVSTSKTNAIFRGIRSTPSTIVTYKYRTRYNGQEVSGSIPFSVKINKVYPTAVYADQNATVGWGLETSLRYWFDPQYAEARMQFESDNPSVVSVDGYGNIKGNSLGYANIFIYTDNGLRTQARVRCVIPPVKKLKITGNNDVKLYPGDQLQLYCNVTPVHAEPALNWYSSDNSIARVDQKGLVTIVGSGTVHIYCVDTKTDKKADVKLKPKKQKE